MGEASARRKGEPFVADSEAAWVEFRAGNPAARCSATTTES